MVDIPEKLSDYLKLDHLDYFALADAYLWVSRTIWDTLSKYSFDLEMLKLCYENIMDLIKELHQKERKGTRDEKIEGKETVWANRNYVKDLMNLYINTIQNLEQNIQYEKNLKQQNDQFRKQYKYLKIGIFTSFGIGLIAIIIALIFGIVNFLKPC